MEKVLVIAEEIFLNLYRPGLEYYSKNHDNLTIDIYCLDVPKKELNTFDRLRYKFGINNFKRNYYEQKRKELIELVEQYNQILFIDLFYDEEYFIQGKFAEVLKKKKCKVYFVDSIQTIPQNIAFWNCFDGVFSFEYSDIEFCKSKFNIEVSYVPVGTNYNLYNLRQINDIKYDLCFVGLSTPKRIEYLQAIAQLCKNKGYRLFIAGHFWHNNNLLNFTIGKLKFKLKHPLLSRYVVNKFIQPYELANIYHSSKICLNINVAHHKSFNPRNFDIMHSGKLLISDEQNLQGVDIVPDKDFIMCDGIDDMVAKIDFYLQNEDQYRHITDSAKRKVEQKYLFNNTLDVIFKE